MQRLPARRLNHRVLLRRDNWIYRRTVSGHFSERLRVESQKRATDNQTSTNGGAVLAVAFAPGFSHHNHTFCGRLDKK
jgi:hypothetical protein